MERLETTESLVTEQELARLFRKKKGNLREIWLALYDNHAFGREPTGD